MPRRYPAYQLVFITAQWCDPARPMARIFDEVSRELSREYMLESLIIDIDDEETDQLIGAGKLHPAILEQIDYVPMILLLKHGDLGSLDSQALHQTLTSDQPHETVAFKPYNRHPQELLLKLAGQLPKRAILHNLREIFDHDAT